MSAHFLSAGRFIAIEPWRHGRRTLSHDVLLMGLHGCLHIAQDEALYELRFGEIIHLRANVMHYGYQDDMDVSYYWAHFIPDEDSPDLPSFATPTASENALILFRQLLLFANRPDGDKRLLECMLNALLWELDYELNRQTTHARREFADILEWIRVNLDHPFTLNDIANEFHYSPKYFSTLFMKRCGAPLTNYLQEQRMNRACGLLLNSTRTIAEIAASCGFRDEKYFMRVFKSKMGMTAKAYRMGGDGVHMNSH